MQVEKPEKKKKVESRKKVLKTNENTDEYNNESNEYPVELKESERNDSEGEETIQIQMRLGFIRKVYGILSIQLIITFGAVLLFQLPSIKNLIMAYQQMAGNVLIMCSLGFLVLFLILACNRKLSRTVPCNYIFLFAITLCEALACAIVSSIYSFPIVATALVLTIITTLALTFYACTTKTNFSSCRAGLYVAFCQIFMIGLIAVLFRLPALYAVYTFSMTIVVGIYIVYDTQLIMAKFGIGYSVDDYIFATLEIYMDIIRLFLLILRILGNSRRH